MSDENAGAVPINADLLYHPETKQLLVTPKDVASNTRFYEVGEVFLTRVEAGASPRKFVPASD